MSSRSSLERRGRKSAQSTLEIGIIDATARIVETRERVGAGALEEGKNRTTTTKMRLPCVEDFNLDTTFTTGYL